MLQSKLFWKIKEYSAGIYFFKVNNRKVRTIVNVNSKDTRQLQILNIDLFPLLTLKK